MTVEVITHLEQLVRSFREQITVAKLVGLEVQDLAAVEVVLERCS